MNQEELTKLEYQDRLKIRELCSTCQVRLFEILGQLDTILNVLRAIDVPELSSYTKIELKQEKSEEVKLVEKLTGTTLTEVDGVKRFVRPAKQDLASIAMTLARNLELNLKKE